MRLIDADALLDEVMDRYCEECDKRKGIKNGKFRIIYEIGDAPCRACEIDDMKTELEYAPTVDPFQHGRWIYSAGFDLDGVTYAGRYRCDQCNHWIDAGDDGNYCPNCGAKMDGVEE